MRSSGLGRPSYALYIGLYRCIGHGRYFVAMQSTTTHRASRAAEIGLAAKLFAGFSDRTRLAILVELSEGECRVTDLVTALAGSQGNISGHLACLKECGLVRDRPEGRQVFYSIAYPEVLKLLRGAEALLALTGRNIQLCQNYETGS